MRLLLAMVACSIMAGCQGAPKQTLSSEQWAAIETREVDGTCDDVLRAASAVVLDKGLFYLASDHDAGILTAEYIPFEQQELFRRSGGMHGSALANTLSIWVRQAGPRRTEARVQMRMGGVRVADEKRVTNFWAAVERRMLGGDAAAQPSPKGGA